MIPILACFITHDSCNWLVQCDVIIWRSISPLSSQQTPHSSPVRARYGVYVVSFTSDSGSAAVIIVLCVMWYVGPRYNTLDCICIVIPDSNLHGAHIGPICGRQENKRVYSIFLHVPFAGISSNSSYQIPVGACKENLVLIITVMSNYVADKGHQFKQFYL